MDDPVLAVGGLPAKGEGATRISVERHPEGGQSFNMVWPFGAQNISGLWIN